MRSILPDSCSYAWTGYANPHAVTGMSYTSGGTTNYVYDNNGNLTSSSGKGYTWDYRNRLTAAGATGATTTYTYDHENQRVQKKTSTETTTYVNRYYNIASTTNNATATKHIFTPSGELLATVIGTSSAATTTYLHLDHLGGLNVATDGNQTSSQVLDYYPYGSQRIATGSHDSQRRFIGEHYDPETEFSYLNARYYEGSRGQFLSQDPAFQTLSRLDVQLGDPQSWNSYSYARNNPLILIDQAGDFWEFSVSGTYSGLSGSAGLRVSTNGLNLFASGGAGLGAVVSAQATYTPGDISHQMEVTDNVGLSAAYYVGLGRAFNVQQRKEQNYYVVGVGADVYARREVSIPIFGSKPPAGSILGPSSGYSTPNYQLNLVSPAPSTNQTTNVSNPAQYGSSATQKTVADPWATLTAAIQQYYAEGGK